MKHIWGTLAILLMIICVQGNTVKSEMLVKDNLEVNEESLDDKKSLIFPYDIYSFSLDDINSYPDIVPLQKRLTKAYPSSTGLYPHEILVLNYAESFSTEQEKFQQFWLYYYSVENVQDVLTSLVDQGYLSFGDIMITLKNHTVNELKTALKVNQLKVSGKKDELIQRLIQNIDEERLRELFPAKFYLLTEKGTKELEDNSYVIRCHKGPSGDIGVWAMNRLLHLNPGWSYKEIIEEYLRVTGNEYYAHNDFGLYRNAHLKLYDYLIKENRPEEAFANLAEVLFIDLSGCDNGFNIENLEIYAQYFFPYEKSLVLLPPATVEWLDDIEKEFDWEDETLEKELYKQMSGFHLPFHLFTPEECAHIAVMRKNGRIEDIKSLYQAAEIRFRINYPSIDISDR